MCELMIFHKEIECTELKSSIRENQTYKFYLLILLYPERCCLFVYVYKSTPTSILYVFSAWKLNQRLGKDCLSLCDRLIFFLLLLGYSSPQVSRFNSIIQSSANDYLCQYKSKIRSNSRKKERNNTLKSFFTNSMEKNLSSFTFKNV